MKQRNVMDERGFSLIEMMISLAVGAILLSALYGMFIMQNKAYAVQDDVVDMQQNLRASLDLMTTDGRVAAYGFSQKAPIANWVTWVGVTANPEITAGVAGAPDTLSLIACFDGTTGTTSLAAVSGAITLTLGAGEGAKFNTGWGKVIYIGSNENAVVTTVAGDIITIDTDPATAGNQGLSQAYPAGTTVEQAKVVTYHVVNNTLMRNENQGNGDQVVGDNIDGFTASRAGNVITLSLTGRTRRPDPNYTHPTLGDHYRRKTITVRVDMRNQGD